MKNSLFKLFLYQSRTGLVPVLSPGLLSLTSLCHAQNPIKLLYSYAAYIHLGF